MSTCKRKMEEAETIRRMDKHENNTPQQQATHGNAGFIIKEAGCTTDTDARYKLQGLAACGLSRRYTE